MVVKKKVVKKSVKSKRKIKGKWSPDIKVKTRKWDRYKDRDVTGLSGGTTKDIREEHKRKEALKLPRYVYEPKEKMGNWRKKNRSKSKNK
jgi:hypothetical protein